MYLEAVYEVYSAMEDDEDDIGCKPTKKEKET